jgi:peptidoglycan hydrolase-like protein with peptidoglycan-binding domain
MSNLEDLQAINGYFRSAQTKTDEAARIKTEFLNWYNGLSLIFTASDDELASAKAKRDAFNTANNSVLSFVPRDMTPADETEIKNLGSVEVAPTATAEEKKAAAWDKSRGTQKAKLTTEQSKQQFASSTSSTSPTAALRGKTLPTLKRWASNPPEYVNQWEMILGVSPTGKFGPGDEAATKAWQIARGLPGTGVVDAATWQKAIGSTTVPQNGTVNLAENLGPTNTPGPKKSFQQAVAEIKTPEKAVPALVAKQATTQASVFGIWSKLPLWGKAILGAITATAVSFGLTQNGAQKRKS